MERFDHFFNATQDSKWKEFVESLPGETITLNGTMMSTRVFIVKNCVKLASELEWDEDARQYVLQQLAKQSRNN